MRFCRKNIERLLLDIHSAELQDLYLLFFMKLFSLIHDVTSFPLPFQKKGIIRITVEYNKMKGISYLTITGEYGVILNVKPTTPEHDMEPYRAISLLPTMGKLLEKLKRMKKYIAIHCLVSDHPLVFREKHSTFDQIHRIVNSISKSF